MNIHSPVAHNTLNLISSLETETFYLATKIKFYESVILPTSKTKCPS